MRQKAAGRDRVFGSDLLLGGRMTAKVADEVTVSLRSVADNVYTAVGGLSSAPTVVFKEEAEEEPEGRPGEDESGKMGTDPGCLDCWTTNLRFWIHQNVLMTLRRQDKNLTVMLCFHSNRAPCCILQVIFCSRRRAHLSCFCRVT